MPHPDPLFLQPVVDTLQVRQEQGERHVSQGRGGGQEASWDEKTVLVSIPGENTAFGAWRDPPGSVCGNDRGTAPSCLVILAPAPRGSAGQRSQAGAAFAALPCAGIAVPVLRGGKEFSAFAEAAREWG